MSMISAFFATTAKAEAAAAQTFLLDEYGTDIVLAYSLRKLSSTYAGDAIRVRESSGNTEADIGFDSNGNLDESALLSHVGSNNGFIVTWYDQSGQGGNVQNATTSEQPQIVSSGTVLKSNGKPVIEGNNASSAVHLDLLLPKNNYIPSTGQYFFFSVCNTNTNSVLYAVFQYLKQNIPSEKTDTDAGLSSSRKHLSNPKEFFSFII